MPCFYPEGEPSEWCERHATTHVIVVGLRAQERPKLSA